jgi:glycosyltransferase involved in cell wall biosynthesis
VRKHRRWSITILTLPERDRYLDQTLRSLARTRVPGPAELVIVYNVRARGATHLVERKIQRLLPRLEVSVHFNSQDRSIVGGRNFQLNVCRGDLICFLDDDVTVHGDVFPSLEDALRRRPLGLVGLRSYQNDTNVRFKPRSSTPFVDLDGVRYMTVQGLLAAGYRDLLDDLGGFNPRRRYWGEWTELNLRLWRNGFPTGYRMEGGYLRHWLDAPSSPTRNLDGRASHVLWGLICTAIEYDAVDATEATEAFWQLVEDRYLSYSFGKELSPQVLLRTTLELMPALAAEWGAIAQSRDEAATHRFPFKPFHRLTRDDVGRVLAFAQKAIRRYRERVWR